MKVPKMEHHVSVGCVLVNVVSPISPTFLERAWRMLMGIMMLQKGPLKEVPGKLPSVTAKGLGSYAVEGKVNPTSHQVHRDLSRIGSSG